MDEADILGDRIAIMADGELKAVGSSFFLKKRFGTGYRLICVKKTGCRAQKLEEALINISHDIKLDSDSQSEVTFILSESNLHLFHDIFKYLEDNSEKLRISSFGCSLTTMEEVFLKIGSDSLNFKNQDNLNHNSATIHEIDEENDVSVFDFENCVQFDKVKGLNLLRYQCEATIFKKFFYLRRNCFNLIVSILCIIFIIYCFLNKPIDDYNPRESLKISLGDYEETTVLLGVENKNSKYE